MNNLLLDLLTYINTNHPELVPDVNLFMLMKPIAPDSLVAITEYAGTGTAAFTNTSVRSVQVLVRDRLNADASALAWQLYKTLVTTDHFLNLGEGRISIVNPRNAPFKLATDQEARHEWVFNLGITYNNY